MTSELERSLDDLRGNLPQWKAFTTRSNCVVLAPPGSGKTKLLTTRMAYDLEHHIPAPQGAACITLTNAAADELQRRLDWLGVIARPSTFVGTVHSFAFGRVIRPFAGAVGRPDLASLGVASKEQCSEAMKSAVRDAFGHEVDTRFAESTVNVARARLTHGDGWLVYGPQIRGAAELYELNLLNQGVLDFNGLISAAAWMVQSFPALRKVLQTAYPALYVDEYQDLAPGLDCIVRSLCLTEHSKTCLFAVGDPDQAVYGFTGTRPELLLDLISQPSVTKIELDRNYRSGQSLIDLASRMRIGRPPVLGMQGGGVAASVHCPNGLEEQVAAAVDFVVRASRDGTPLHEIAIICPWNQHCEMVATALRDAGIATRVQESAYRSTVLTRLMEASAVWSINGRETSGYRLSEIVRDHKTLLGTAWNRQHEVSFTRALLSGPTVVKDVALTFVESLVACGFAEFSENSRTTEEINALSQMLGALREGILAGISLESFAARSRRLDRVEVLNMTICKGLEFDKVVMLGLDDELVPHYKALAKPNELAEDRRKFYVALTRARKEVCLLYSGFVVTPWGARKYAGPSRFMREVGLIGGL